MSYKIGTREKPMKLKTPPLSSDFTMHTDEKDGTVETWGRSAKNPVKGWNGLKKGFRGGWNECSTTPGSTWSRRSNARSAWK